MSDSFTSSCISHTTLHPSLSLGCFYPRAPGGFTQGALCAASFYNSTQAAASAVVTQLPLITVFAAPCMTLLVKASSV